MSNEALNIQIAVDRSSRNVGIEIADRWKEVSIGVERGGAYYPPYEGSYHIIPALYRQQRMRTHGKSMTSDVLIDAIKFTETENPQGGRTIVIG